MRTITARSIHDARSRSPPRCSWCRGQPDRRDAALTSARGVERGDASGLRFGL